MSYHLIQNLPSLTTADLVDRVGDSGASHVGRRESRVLDVARVPRQRSSRCRKGEYAADPEAARVPITNMVIT